MAYSGTASAILYLTYPIFLIFSEMLHVGYKLELGLLNQGKCNEQPLER
jgi:hypothetical protein